MAPVSNTALRITELDFDSIKENLKNYLRSQSEFQDYDFDGSGMSVLLDILAYNTHYMGYYLNMVGNEMFMDTAQLRSSILSHAKNINYQPVSRRGAKALVNILVTPSNTEDNTATSLQLTKYTNFLGKDIDGINYNFVTLNANTVAKNTGTFSFANVEIQQGQAVTLQYVMSATNTKRRFKIPSANVDTDTVEVRVIESTSNTDTTIYTKSNNIIDLNSNSTVYFIEESDDLTYNIYFGDGVIGKKPKVGNVIQLTYLDTAGIGANNISAFTTIDRIGGLYRDNVVVSTVTSSYAGTDKETIEQIRFRAPYAYSTQNRAVTTGDYETLILKDYPNIDAVSVWGGEDNDPVVYGKVFISLKTKQNYALTNADKEYIKDTLIRNRNVVTVTPEIIDPDYTYIRVVGKVNYSPTLTTLSENQLQALVKAAIYDYNDNELSDFGAVFRKSKLQAYIEAADKSITGSDITIYVQKRVILNTSTSQRYDIAYNMPLRKGTFADRISSFPEIYTFDGNGIERNTLFEEILDSPSGINSFVITDAGSSYESAPTVTISGDGSGATAVAKVSNGKVTSIEIVNKGTDYTKAIVEISGGGGSGATASALLENNYGTIRSFYYKTTGEKVTINSNAGTINYTTGLLTISSLLTSGAVDNDFYPTDTVTFFAPIGAEIVQPLRNRIILVDDADAKSTQIQMVAES
jgi:uncharacterized pyridoxamine 5'-phosphate oxidase family protein